MAIAARWRGAPLLLLRRVLGPCAAWLIACGTYTQDELGSRHTTPHNTRLAATAFPVAAHPSATASNSAPARGVVSPRGEDTDMPTSRVTNATRNLALSGGRRSVQSEAGMVVSVSADATHIGVKVLEQGGNAVDAAVAVAVALAVTHPSAGNLGGGGFALVRLQNGETAALDFREASPRALARARFVRMIQSGGEGADSVAVPGSVAGWVELSSRFGRTPFASLVRPAQVLAEAGHRVSAREANAIRSAWPKLKQHALPRQRYGTAGGHPVPAGTWLRLPELAVTLSAIQAEGARGFYAGSVGASMLRALGPSSQLSLDDLAAYRAIWRRPLVVPYRDIGVTTMPPPSAGGAALAESLVMLNRYDPRTLARGSTAHAHVLLEIMRRAQADRIYRVVDPDTWSDGERSAHLASFVDPERWLRRIPIDTQRATANAQIVAEDGLVFEAEHTTHLAVIDREGMAVSLTTTLSSGFGSKVVTDTGIVLNNAVGSFSGLGENQPLPNRRTTSSMAPTMVEDASGLRLVLGTPGGDTIPSTLLQLVNSLVDYSVPIDLAVDAPRLHQGVARRAGARLEGHRPISADVRHGLAKLGHKFDQPTGTIGHANTIGVIGGIFYGYVDPREGGLALGPAQAP